MIITDIRSALVLNRAQFTDPALDIDQLVRRAAADLVAACPLSALGSIQAAADLVEPFHSYFHFEETCLYTELGDHYLAAGDYIKALSYYQGAIRQHHQNPAAYLGIIECYERLEHPEITPKGIADTKNEAASYGLDLALPLEQLRRPYPDFAAYLRWCGCVESHGVVSGLMLAAAAEEELSFWDYWQRYAESGAVDQLERAQSDLQFRHRLYHCAAAIIYYNLSQAYEALAIELEAVNPANPVVAATEVLEAIESVSRGQINSGKRHFKRYDPDSCRFLAKGSLERAHNLDLSLAVALESGELEL